MKSLKADQPEDRPMGSGRRAYVRYPVVMDAALITSEGAEIPCEMKDFCVGGMLLNFRGQAAKGTVHSFVEHQSLTVRSVVPIAGGDKVYEFQARVVRNVQDGVGIAFIDPDRGALQAMQQFALQFSKDADKTFPPNDIKGGRGHVGGLFGRRFIDVVAGCGRIAEETMDSLLEQLDVRLALHLFELSRDTLDPHAQTALFDASELIKKRREKFIAAVRSSFQERLQSNLKNQLNEKKARGDITGELTLESMSLIADEDLGVWLAVSDVTSKVEERFKEALATLEERLSVLFNAHTNHANNPYGPALFAESFQVGLSQFGFKEIVNTACYTVLKDILISLLSDLYSKLNDILVEYGILPKLTYSMLRRSALAKRKPEVVSTAPQSTPQVHDASSMLATAEDSGAANFNRDLKKPGAASPAETASAKGNPQQDLYQVVQDLRALRKDLVQHRTQSPLASLGPSPSVAELAGLMSDSSDVNSCYTTSELVETIADMQGRGREDEGHDDRVTHVKARVVAALLSRDPIDRKKLNPRDSNVLEVTGDLLEAMHSDPLVAESVKPWLKQLELPVLKLALRDPTMFFDHTHVARQVVNNIAQLEFYRQGKGRSKQNSISAAIEELLDIISKERDDGIDIFTEILDKLNKLIKIQDKAYQDNVKDVIKECEKNSPEAEAHEEAHEEEAEPSKAEINKWIMHARRLRAGDTVLYADKEDKRQRLRVAWMDEKQSIYVFVNLRGIKDRVLAIADVARLMRLGVLEPQSNAADPAMDRAQYVIMQNLYQQVLHESTHDGMTGLINRREFDRLINDAVTSAKRDDLRHVLLFVDVDKFSAINNSCGYAGGDSLLRGVVDQLRDSMGGRGEIARLGGDQFGILIKSCSLDDALATAERQIEDVADYQFKWDDDYYSVTLSVGLVPISNRSGDVDELLRSAESCCNIAKDMGGNRLQVFHSGHARLAHQSDVMKWIGKIDKMLAEDALEIRCQRIDPIAADLSTQPSFEVLVGVRDEQGNIGSPSEFIKAAEWYRRMPAVDRHVIIRTLSWMESNPAVIDKITGLSINLSGQSINEEGFFDFVMEQLNNSQVPREKICFEVTETVGISNLSNAALFIERIKDAGCRFSLDDFGSGMSSYGYLKNLPVDIVKIDGAFIQNLVAGSSDYAVVKSITEIAHFMSKKVVAEFVENSEALELLREIGVDYVQGYMLDRPDVINRLLTMDFAH